MMEHGKMKQEDNSTYTFVKNLRDKLLERTYLSENYDIRIDTENNDTEKETMAIVAKHKKGEMEFTLYIGAPDDSGRCPLCDSAKLVRVQRYNG